MVEEPPDENKNDFHRNQKRRIWFFSLLWIKYIETNRWDSIVRCDSIVSNMQVVSTPKKKNECASGI